uniref:Voltage-gated hydrogen channel 1 n=1 Tax=Macrostomum lignano TaxID=282301 RepID=A0A1I8GWV1_9PLAT
PLAQRGLLLPEFSQQLLAAPQFAEKLASGMNAIVTALSDARVNSSSSASTSAPASPSNSSGPSLFSSFHFEFSQARLLHSASAVLHFVSIAILALFVSEVALKIVCLGRGFLRDRFEVVDAVVIAVSFVADVVFVKLESSEVSVIVLFLLWRIVRVINGLMMHEKQRDEFRIQLQKRARRISEMKCESLENDRDLQEKHAIMLEELCRELGATEEQTANCKPKFVCISKQQSNNAVKSMAAMSAGIFGGIAASHHRRTLNATFSTGEASASATASPGASSSRLDPIAEDQAISMATNGENGGCRRPQLTRQCRDDLEDPWELQSTSQAVELLEQNPTMSLEDSSDSSSSDAPPATPTPLCIICDQAAVGVAPFSRCHMCSQHLSVDVANLFKLKEEVEELLRAYSQEPQESQESQDSQESQGAEGAASRAALLRPRQDAESLRRLALDIQQQLQEVNHKFDLVQQHIDSFRSRVTGQLSGVLEAVRVPCTKSLGDLEADFERSERLLRDQSDNEELQLRLLGQLERLVGICAGRSEDQGDWLRDAAVTATSEEIDREIAAAERERMKEPMVFSHEVTRITYWCCLWTASQKLRCHCDIDWKQRICGLHCDRQLLFIAQPDAVTVTDLSGRAVRRVRPHIEGFGDIRGIGGNAASVFVSSGNKIAAFSKATWQMETVITLSQLPRARLGNLATHDNCILVTDWEHDQVHRVRIDTQQLVASFPTQRSDLQQFKFPYDVAVDSRGRLFSLISSINTQSLISSINTQCFISSINTQCFISSINTQCFISSINTQSLISSINTQSLISSINTQLKFAFVSNNLKVNCRKAVHLGDLHHPAGIEDFNPVAVRVQNEGEALHLAVVRLLGELHAESVETPAGLGDIRDADADVAEAAGVRVAVVKLDHSSPTVHRTRSPVFVTAAAATAWKAAVPSQSGVRAAGLAGLRLRLRLLLGWQTPILHGAGTSRQPLPPGRNELGQLVQLPAAEHPMIGQQVQQVHQPRRRPHETRRQPLVAGWRRHRSRRRQLAKVAKHRLEMTAQHGLGVVYGHVAVLCEGGGWRVFEMAARWLLAIEDSNSTRLVQLVLPIQNHSVEHASPGQIFHSQRH